MKIQSHKIKEPQIFVANNEMLAESLSEIYEDVYSGNVGILQSVNYDNGKHSKYLGIEWNAPSNLHEYGMLIFDIQGFGPKKEWDYQVDNMLSVLFKVDYPTTVFNPQPLVMDIIKEDFHTKMIKIYFAGYNQEFTYDYYKEMENGYKECIDRKEVSMFKSIHAISKPKEGKKFSFENNVISTIIKKYCVKYHVVFNLPTVWDQEKRSSVIDRNYYSLAKNKDGEVVAYIGYDSRTGYELVLPYCKEKDKLIKELCVNVFPNMFGEIFTESSTFDWLDNECFKSSEVLQLEQKREEENERHNDELKKIDEMIEESKVNEKYLHNMLIETGEQLVESVKEYFESIGFQNIILVDEKEDGNLKEDMQIIDGDNMYIIEIKGIGGTSKDSECAQIAKHRRRREKENRDKNIIPIYIVNHQRFVNPLHREKPPFSSEQIEYAINDERGLLTTFQLYQQYKLIERGIFTKEEVRSTLLGEGLISFVPSNFKLVGEITEYFNGPQAGIIEALERKISKNLEVICNKGDEWKITTIESIQINESDVDEASSGQVGICFSEGLSKGYRIYFRDVLE